MKKHTKIYIDYFNYKIPQDVLCEICGAPAVDIHHIEARGMGGSKEKDTIDNLMALYRHHHEMYGDKKKWKTMLKTIHATRL